MQPALYTVPCVYMSPGPPLLSFPFVSTPTGAIVVQVLDTGVDATSWAQLLTFLGNTDLWQTSCSSGSYNLSAPSSAMIPEL